ncbi:hypothetical protein [Salisediminibacterium beveridgei]|uniref:Uncharacterized protein n=1 Tax=Salisediminibacterium beveridgei TaxID=632773 RepID=A0A1D7QSD6_9BACI|nr:hypothetical protein [Salisediminibacterium beveridgei]AOM81918.1 hypothetical protein BBEV_0525 [Salisediminibacterium beveridgei]
MTKKDNNNVVPMQMEVPVEELVGAFADLNEYALTHYQEDLERYQLEHFTEPEHSSDDMVQAYQMTYIWNMMHAPIVSREEGTYVTIHQHFTELAEKHEQYSPVVLHAFRKLDEISPDVYEVTALVKAENEEGDTFLPLAASIVHDHEPLFIPTPEHEDYVEGDLIVCFGYPVDDAVIPLMMPFRIAAEHRNAFENAMVNITTDHDFESTKELMADPAGSFFDGVLLPFVNELYEMSDLLDEPLENENQQAVDDLLRDVLEDKYPEDVVETVRMMWQSFCLHEDPTIRSVPNHAAAMLYEALSFLASGFKVTLQEAAELFDAKPSGMKHARLKLETFIDEHYGDASEDDEAAMDLDELTKLLGEDEVKRLFEDRDKN